MANRVLGFILLLALAVSACDTESTVEPIPANPSVPVADKAIQMKTTVINEVIGGAEGVSQLYLATGELDYIMIDGPVDGGPCASYTIHAFMSGVISPVPNDQSLWSFDGTETVSVCIGSEPYSLQLVCPLLGRTDGAVILLDLAVTASGLTVIGAVIEVPDATPVGS